MKKNSNQGPGGPGRARAGPPDAARSAERKARAAEALRQNLLRRKAQARGRKAEMNAGKSPEIPPKTK